MLEKGRGKLKICQALRFVRVRLPLPAHKRILRILGKGACRAGSRGKRRKAPFVFAVRKDKNFIVKEKRRVKRGCRV